MQSSHPRSRDSVQFRRILLEQVRVAARSAITKELLEQAGGSDLEVIVENEVDRMAVELHRHVSRHLLLSGHHEVDCWIDIPWTVDVLIEPEPRLVAPVAAVPGPEGPVGADLGRDPSSGKATVGIRHLIQFPHSDIVWPERMGEPVRYQELSVIEDPSWRSPIDVAAGGRPWAATRDLRP